MFYEKPGKLYYQIKKVMLSVMIAFIMLFNFAMMSQLYAATDDAGAFTIEDFTVFEVACSDEESYINDGAKNYNCKILGFEETGTEDYEYSKTSDLFLGSEVSTWIQGNPVLTGNILYYLTGNTDYLNSTSQDYSYTENPNNYYSLYEVFKYAPNWTYTNNYKYTLKTELDTYGEFYSSSNPVDSLYQYQETEKGDIEYSIYFDLSKLQNNYVFTQNDFSGFNEVDSTVNTDQSYNTKVTSISNLFSYNYQLYSYMVTHITTDINGKNVEESNNTTPYYNSTDKLYYIYNEEEGWFDVYTFDSSVASKWADSSLEDTLSKTNFYPLNKSTEAYIKTNIRAYYDWEEYEYIVSSSEDKTTIGGQLTKPADVSGSNTYTYYDNEETDYYNINYNWSWEYIVPVWEEGFYFTTDWYENKNNAISDNSLNSEDYTLEQSTRVTSSKTQGTYESVDSYNVVTSVKTGTTESINSKINNILYQLSGTQYQFKTITTANKYVLDENSKVTYNKYKTISEATKNCSYGIGNGAQFVSTKCIFSKTDSGYRDYSIYKWNSNYYFQTEVNSSKKNLTSKFTLSSAYETLPVGSTTSSTKATAYLDTSSGLYFVESTSVGTKQYQYRKTYGWTKGSSSSETVDLLTTSDPNYSGAVYNGNTVKNYTSSSVSKTYSNGFYPYTYHAGNSFASSIPSDYQQYTIPTISSKPTYYTTYNTVMGYRAKYSQKVKVASVSIVYRKGRGDTSLSKNQGTKTYYAPAAFIYAYLSKYIPSSDTCKTHSIPSCPFITEKNEWKTLYSDDSTSEYLGEALQRITWYTDDSLSTTTSEFNTFLDPETYRNVILSDVNLNVNQINKDFSYKKSMNNSNSYNSVYYYPYLYTNYYSSLSSAQNAVPSDNQSNDFTYTDYNTATHYNYKTYILKNAPQSTGTSNTQDTTGFQWNSSDSAYRLYYSDLISHTKTYNYTNYSWGAKGTSYYPSIYRILLNGTVVASAGSLYSSTTNYSTAPTTFNTSSVKYYYYWSGSSNYTLYNYTAYSKKDGGKYVNTGEKETKTYSSCGESCTSSDNIYQYNVVSGSTYYNWVVANTKIDSVYEYSDSEKEYSYNYYSSMPSNVSPSGNGTGKKYVSTGNIKYLYNIYERQVTSIKNLYRYDSTWRDYTSSSSGWSSLGNPNYKGYTTAGKTSSSLTTLTSCTGNEGYNSGACYIYTGTKENQRISSRTLYRYDVFYNAEKVLKDIKVNSTHNTTGNINKSSSSSATLSHTNYIPNITDQNATICATSGSYNCYNLTGTNRNVTTYYKYQKHVITYKTNSSKTSTVNGVLNGYYDSGYIYKDTETINKVNANGTPTTKNVLNSFNWFRNLSLTDTIKYYNGSQIVLESLNTNVASYVNKDTNYTITLSPNTTYTFAINGYVTSGSIGKVVVMLNNVTMNNSSSATLSASAETKTITFTTDSTGKVSVAVQIDNGGGSNGKVFINWLQIEKGNSFTSYSSYKTYEKQDTRTNTYYEYFHYTPTYSYYLDNENNDFDYEIKTKIVKYTLTNGNTIENTFSNDEFEYGFVKNFISGNVNLTSIMIGYDFNKDGIYTSNEYWYYRNTPTQWVTANTDENGVVTQKYKLTSSKYQFYYSTSRQVILEVSTNGYYFTKEDYTNNTPSEGDIIVNFNDITNEMINNMSTTGTSINKVLYSNNYYPEDSEIAHYSLLLDYMQNNGLSSTDYQLVYNASKHNFYYYDQTLKTYYQHKIYIDSNKDVQGNKLDKGYTIEIHTKEELLSSLSDTVYFDAKNDKFYNGYTAPLNTKGNNSMLSYVASTDSSNEYGLLLDASLIDFAKSKYIVSGKDSYKLVSQNYNYNSYVEHKDSGYWTTTSGNESNLSDLFSYIDFIENNVSLYIFIYDENGVEKYVPVWANNSTDASTKATVKVPNANVTFGLSNAVILSINEVFEQMKLTNSNKIKITNLDKEQVYVELDNYFVLDGTSEYVYVLTTKSNEFSFTNYLSLDNLEHFYMDDNALGSTWYMYEQNLSNRSDDFTETFEKSLQYSLTRINDVETGGYAVHFNGMHNYWATSPLKLENNDETVNDHIFTVNGGTFNGENRQTDKWLSDSQTIFDGIEKNATINSNLFTTIYDDNGNVSSKLSGEGKDIPEIIMVNTGARDINFYNSPKSQNTLYLHANTNAYDTYALYAINYKGKVIYYEDYIEGMANALTIFYNKIAKDNKDYSYFFTNSTPASDEKTLTYWKNAGLSEDEYYMYAPILFNSNFRKKLATSSFLNLAFMPFEETGTSLIDKIAYETLGDYINNVFTYNASDEMIQTFLKIAFNSEIYGENGDYHFVYDELYFKGSSISPLLDSVPYDDSGRTNSRRAEGSSDNMSAGILADSYVPYVETIIKSTTGYKDYATRSVDYLSTAQLPIPLSNYSSINTYSSLIPYDNAKTAIFEALTVENMLQAIRDSWNEADKDLLYVDSGIEDLSLVYRKLSDVSMIRDQFTNTIVWNSKYNNGAIFGNLMFASRLGDVDMFNEDFSQFGSMGFVATLSDYVPQNYYLDNNNNKMKAFELEFSSNNFNTGYDDDYGDINLLLVNDLLGTSGIDVRYSRLTNNTSGDAVAVSNNGATLWNNSIYSQNGPLYEGLKTEQNLNYKYVIDHALNTNFYFFTFYGLNFNLEKMKKDDENKAYNVLPSGYASAGTGYYIFHLGSYIGEVSPSDGLYYTNYNADIALPYILDYITNNFKNNSSHETFIKNNYFSSDFGIFYPNSEYDKQQLFDEIIYGFAIYEDKNYESLLTNEDVANLRNHELESLRNDDSMGAIYSSEIFYGINTAHIDYTETYRRATLVTGSSTSTTSAIDLYIDFGNDKIETETAYTKFDINTISSDSDGTKGNTNFELKINLSTKNGNYGFPTTAVNLYGDSLLNAYQNYELQIYYLNDTNKACTVGYTKYQGKCYLTNLGYQSDKSDFDTISSGVFSYTVYYNYNYDEWVDEEGGYVTQTATKEVEVNSAVPILKIDPMTLEYSTKSIQELKDKSLKILKKKYKDDPEYRDTTWEYKSYEINDTTYNVNHGYWNIINLDYTDNGTITINSAEHSLLPETQYFVAARIRFKDGSVSGVTYAKYESDTYSSTGDASVDTLENYTTPSAVFSVDMVNNPYGSLTYDSLIKGCEINSSLTVCSGDELLTNPMIPAWLNEMIFSVPSSYETYLNNSLNDEFKNIMKQGYTPGFEKYKKYISSYMYNNLLTEEEQNEYKIEKNSKDEITGYYKEYSISNVYRLHLTDIMVTGVRMKLLEVNFKTGDAKAISNLTGQFSFIKGNNSSLKNSNNTATASDGVIYYSLSENDYIAKSSYTNELKFVGDYLLNYNIFNIYVTNSNLSKSDKVYRLSYSNQYGDMFSYIDYNLDNELSEGTLSKDCYDEFGNKITEEQHYKKYLNSFYDTYWNYEYNSDGSISERKFIAIDKMVYLGHVRNGKVDTIITG